MDQFSSHLMRKINVIDVDGIIAVSALRTCSFNRLSGKLKTELFSQKAHRL